MKKCSTAAFALSLALTCIAAPAGAGERCAFLESAAERHTVVPGDTLWDLASVFLANPWCWPEVWAMNRGEIRDPHRIYPGQVIVFDRQKKRLAFAPEGGSRGPLALQQRAPAVRSESLREAAIPAIQPAWQQAAGELWLIPTGSELGLPRIVGFADSRSIAATGDTALVDAGSTGPLATGQRRRVMRILPPIVDPDDGRVLATALQEVGEAEFIRTDEQGLGAFKIIDTRSELLAGDLLIPPAGPDAGADQPLHLHPAPPFTGRVAAMLHGGRWAAQRDIVALNRGTDAGLRAGSLVSVVRQVRIADHDASQRPRPGQTSASSRAIATLVVVDARERASLAIVLRSDDAFSTGEAVRSVETDAR